MCMLSGRNDGAMLSNNRLYYDKGDSLFILPIFMVVYQELGNGVILDLDICGKSVVFKF